MSKTQTTCAKTKKSLPDELVQAALVAYDKKVTSVVALDLRKV